MKLRYKIAVTLLVSMVVALSSLAPALSYNSACVAPPVLSGNATPMKAVVYRCYGSPDVLELADIE